MCVSFWPKPAKVTSPVYSQRSSALSKVVKVWAEGRQNYCACVTLHQSGANLICLPHLCTTWACRAFSRGADLKGSCATRAKSRCAIYVWILRGVARAAECCPQAPLAHIGPGACTCCASHLASTRGTHRPNYSADKIIGKLPCIWMGPRA